MILYEKLDFRSYSMNPVWGVYEHSTNYTDTWKKTKSNINKYFLMNTFYNFLFPLVRNIIFKFFLKLFGLFKHRLAPVWLELLYLSTQRARPRPLTFIYSLHTRTRSQLWSIPHVPSLVCGKADSWQALIGEREQRPKPALTECWTVDGGGTRETVNAVL